MVSLCRNVGQQSSVLQMRFQAMGRGTVCPFRLQLHSALSNKSTLLSGVCYLPFTVAPGVINTVLRVEWGCGESQKLISSITLQVGKPRLRQAQRLGKVTELAGWRATCNSTSELLIPSLPLPKYPHKALGHLVKMQVQKEWRKAWHSSFLTNAAGPCTTLWAAKFYTRLTERFKGSLCSTSDDIKA